MDKLSTDTKASNVLQTTPQYPASLPNCYEKPNHHLQSLAVHNDNGQSSNATTLQKQHRKPLLKSHRNVFLYSQMKWEYEPCFKNNIYGISGKKLQEKNKHN